MQSVDTDTTQHAEPAGLRLTWFRTSCFCATVSGEGGGRKEGRKVERVREEWVEEEKELAVLCRTSSVEMVVLLIMPTPHVHLCTTRWDAGVSW